MPPSFSAGIHQITPHLTVSDATKAIEFYKRAFGAKEQGRSVTPAAKVMHARLAIGDSHIMLNDAFPEMGGAPAPEAGANSPFAINLYVPDADAVFKAATEAGAQVKMPPTDMFWGDRYAQRRCSQRRAGAASRGHVRQFREGQAKINGRAGGHMGSE